jgi:mono/diheme cytochrome c family protein
MITIRAPGRFDMPAMAAYHRSPRARLEHVPEERKAAVIDSLYAVLGRLGFHDPIHAILVHIPIALVMGALIFLVVALLLRRFRLELTARHVAILAFVFVFPTILTGVFDWLHFYRGALIPPIRAKMILAGSVLVILGVAVILGSEVKVRSVALVVVYALAFVGVVGLGYFGGRLVYGGAVAASPTGETAPGAGTTGEAVFTASCIGCHRNGGNAVSPDRPLRKSALLDSRDEFTAFVRSPRGGMPAFPASAISDADLGELWSYLRAMRVRWNQGG